MASNVQSNGSASLPLTVNDEKQVVTPGGNGNVPTPGVPGSGTVHAGTEVSAAQDPFAKDEAGRKKGPNALSGDVANAQPFDADYGSLKQVFDQHGFQAPTEAQLRSIHAAAGDSSHVQELVSNVKNSITQKDDSQLPKPQAYVTALNGMTDAQQAQRDAQQLNQQQFIEKLGQAKDGDDSTNIGKMKNPAAIVMYVMLKAKQELTLQKREDLKQLQKYSTISDGLNDILSKEYLPAQQKMGELVKNAKGDKKKDQEVEIPWYENINKDNLATDENGQQKLMIDSGVDKNGNANPPTKMVQQDALQNIVSNMQNQIQQVGSRVQREQTNYQGHDSQDSTLSNIITSVQKTFADSSSAILRNVQ